MIPADLPMQVFSGTLQGMAIGAGLLARLYVQPDTAFWMWSLTLLVLMTGGTSGKRRRRYRYR